MRQWQFSFTAGTVYQPVADELTPVLKEITLLDVEQWGEKEHVCIIQNLIMLCLTLTFFK